MKNIIVGQHKQTNPLAQSFTLSSLVRFAAPTIGMMLIFSLYTVIDGIFIAQYAGESALAASNIAYPGINLIFGVAIMFASGGSAIVAKTFGEKKERLASRRFTLILCTAFAVGVILAVAGLIFLDPLLTLLGTTDVLRTDCRSYLAPMLLFAPIIILKTLFDYFFVTAGRPELGFYLSIASGIINSVLDYILLGIFGVGIGGAAWATVTAYTCSAIAGFCYFLNKTSPLYFRRFAWEKSVITGTLSNGSAQMVTQLAVGITTYLFNILTLRFAGENGVAAITIILYAEMLLTAVYLGFTSGVAPVFSYHFGARNRREIGSLLRKSLLFIVASSLLSFAASHIFAKELILSFTPAGSAVYMLALNGFQLFALSFLLCGFNLFTPGFFTAISAGRTSSFCSCARNFVAISAFLFILPHFWGLNGIWLAVPVADLAILPLSLFMLKDYALEGFERPSVDSALDDATEEP